MRKNRGFEIVNEEMRYTTGGVVMPQRSTSRSAGHDFIVPMCYDGFEIKPFEQKLVWTDVKVYMLDDEYLELVIRSSKAIKNDLQLKNTIGVIDADYCDNVSNDGNIGICIWNCSDETYILEGGEKIAQGIFKKYLTTDDDCVTAERTSGIGSTGK